jgi:hypothetical protein
VQCATRYLRHKFKLLILWPFMRMLFREKFVSEFRKRVLQSVPQMRRNAAGVFKMIILRGVVFFCLCFFRRFLFGSMSIARVLNCDAIAID